MNKAVFDNLRIGDLVRQKTGANSYRVIDTYKDDNGYLIHEVIHLIKAENPVEWDLVNFKGEVISND